MNAPGLRISTTGDFPNVAVYERPGPQGQIASVVFANPEYDETWRANASAFGVLMVMLAFVAGALLLPDRVSGEVYVGWWIVGIAVFLVVLNKAKMPWRIPRTVELDFGADAIRVLRDGRREMERPLSRLANLTVEDHPEAAMERQARQEKGDRKPTRKEQQHCLFGWFGAGGAERVMLLSRAEWPDQRSLFEVRQAILWAIERSGSREKAEAAPQVQSSRNGGLAPPLD